MWSRLARATVATALAILPALSPFTSVPASAAGWTAGTAPILGPAAQGDPCPEPNDSFQNACYLGPSSDAAGYISSARDVDAYRIEVLDFNTDVHVEMPEMPAAYELFLADWNGDEIATSAPGANGAQVIDTTVNIPGAYYIFVHSKAGGFSPGQPYRLFRSLTYPGSKIPDILFTSEFREGSKAATEGDTEFATHSEEGGRYTIKMKIPGTPEDPSQAWWTGFGPEVTDFTMTMDARVANQVDAGFRVFFRHVDNNNTYSLAVDAKDGKVLLMKIVNGETTGNTGWQESSAVDTSGGVNRVVVRCFQDEIRVNVNGEDVFDLKDTAIAKGRIGIGAIAFGPPPVVSFDNIIITTPTEG
ncbi:MAG: hypothetical protein IT306_08105 [Chloroflexi bacterium]|nr:hypothetical protein [Chloroflexota bacterium]